MTALMAVGSAIADGQRDPAAIAALSRADEAIRRLDTLGLRFENVGTGALSGYAAGEAFFTVDLSQAVPREYAAKVSLKGPVFRGFPESFRLWTDEGRVYRALEHEPIVEIEDERNAAYMAWISTFWIPPQLTRPEGFRIEIDQPLVARHLGDSSVGGVATELVYLKFPADSGLGEQYFYLGAEDHLPRRIVMVTTAGMGNEPASMQATFTDIRRNPPREEWAVSREMPPTPRIVDLRDRSVGTGDALPTDWSLATPQGQRMSPLDFRGKVLVLEFFTSSCPFCHRLMPGLNEIYERRQGDGLVVLGVNFFEEDDADAIAMGEELGVSFPILLDGGRVGQQLKVVGTPTALVVDRDGTIAERFSGNVDNRNERLESIVESLLDR